VACDAVCTGSKRNCAPCWELNRRPYRVLVDLADLARGVRDPPSISEFSISVWCALSGAGCRSFEPRPGGADYDEESIRACPDWGGVASHLSSTCLGSASMGDASDGADQSADLDATLEKDQKNHDGFDHSSA
jgi:hypothetical protein